MPLNMSSPRAVNETVDVLDMTAITFDLRGRQVIVSFDEGTDNAGSFETIIPDRIITIPDSELPNLMSIWNGQAGPNRFAQMRRAVLNYIAANFNRAGTVVGEN